MQLEKKRKVGIKNYFFTYLNMVLKVSESESPSIDVSICWDILVIVVSITNRFLFFPWLLREHKSYRLAKPNTVDIHNSQQG